MDFQIVGWQIRDGQEVVEIELADNFEVCGFVAAAACCRDLSFHKVVVEKLPEEEDGALINTEGIVSWISADKKEFFLGGKTGKQVLCKAWGSGLSSPILKRNSVVALGRVVVKGQKNYRNIRVGDSSCCDWISQRLCGLGVVKLNPRILSFQ